MFIQLYLDSWNYKKLSGTIVPNCKKCRSERIIKDGKYKEFQQYKCKDCGFRFSFTSDLPKRRFNSRIIEFAVNMYISTGISLRTIAKKIYKFFKTKVSCMTIARWINAFKMPESNEEIGNSWHADETAIRIKGKIYWLWLVTDRKTRRIISWHLGNRTYEDARIIMLKAKEKAGIPAIITTDGLWEYIRIIRKIFWKDTIHYRVVRAAFGPNSVIERLNREIKRRTKWFSTFQSFESAKYFIENWVNNYNTEKVT